LFILVCFKNCLHFISFHFHFIFFIDDSSLKSYLSELLSTKSLRSGIIFSIQANNNNNNNNNKDQFNFFAERGREKLNKFFEENRYGAIPKLDWFNFESFCGSECLILWIDHQKVCGELQISNFKLSFFFFFFF